MRFLDRILSVSIRVAGPAFVLLAASAPLHAQRQNVVGATVDVVGGLDNTWNQFLPVPGQLGKSEPFYSVYPAVSLNSSGARSLLNANYAFGWNRVETEIPTDSKSHSASLKLSSQLAARWNLSLEESYSQTDDLRTFYALRGIELRGEELVYQFSPLATHQLFRTNQASMGFEHQFSAKSRLSFGGQHSLRNYTKGNVLSGLSNQQSGAVNASYSRRISERTSWSLSYSGVYFVFDNSDDALSNSAGVGLTYVVAKDSTLNLSAGPSYLKGVHSTGTTGGYQALASFQQKIKENYFQFGASQDNGSAIGVGTVSKSRRATVSFNRALGRHVSIFADIGAFDSKGLLDNKLDTQGGAATANVGFVLTKDLSLQVGGQFQRYAKPSPYEFTQKRAFVSLRYTHPNLLRWR